MPRMDVLVAPMHEPGGAWSLQVSLDGETWRPTGIRPTSPIPGAANLPNLQDLIAELEELQELDDIKAALHPTRQKKLGWFLTRSLFGAEGPVLDNRWIHIVPHRSPDGDDAFDYDDFLDFVLRVPWLLMTDSGRPDAVALARLSNDPVAVTVDGGFDLPPDRPWFDHVRLPPHPNILLIVPGKHPPGYPTHGDLHLAALGRTLKSRYVQAAEAGQRPGAIKDAASFSALEKMLGHQAKERFAPWIVYYYGHAAAEGDDVFLMMDDGAHSIAKLADLLRIHRDATLNPPVVWINGCHSGAARLNSAIRLLSPYASTVIATRTLAEVNDARALGEAVLPGIAVGGWSPVSAMRDAIAAQTAATVDSARWATPIVAVQYKAWTALAPERREDLDEESYGDIALRVDRDDQVDRIAALIKTGIESRASHPEIVCWRGARAQGPDIFENRFRDVIHERFADWSPIVRRIELGLDTRLASDKLGAEETKDMLDAQFRARVHDALSDPGGPRSHRAVKEGDLIRALNGRLAGRKCILILSHGPYEDVRRDQLEHYLAFWRRLYPRLTQIDPARQRIVVGIGVTGHNSRSLQDATDIELTGVSPRDIAEHIGRFQSIYGYENISYWSNKIAETCNNELRPIYDTLRKRLGLADQDAMISGGDGHADE